MSQYLPYSEFKCLNQKEIERFDVNVIGENSSIGYILEADLKYPDKLHKIHNEYPLAPGKVEISQNMLSNYCSYIVDEYGMKIGGVNRLVPNLGNKRRCVVHYKNIQLYLSLGTKLNKVHKESDWLKKYIDFNTDKRKK